MCAFPSFSSLSMLSIVAILCLMSKCCTSAPHPCCPGSQHVVSLMSQHSAAFSASMPKASLCQSAESIANALDDQLKAISGCPNGGGSALAAQINASLTPTDDECSRSVGFVRAMFDVAASAASHGGKNSEWANLTDQFRQQVQLIDANCAELGISIGQVNFSSPKGGNHVQVPQIAQVIANPAVSGSHKH